jgi:hypothetical protein
METRTTIMSKFRKRMIEKLEEEEQAELLQERFNLIKKLSDFHPGQVQMVNDKIAHYTGGMKDSGDLNWRYCLFEAELRDLRMVVQIMEKNQGHTKVSRSGESNKEAMLRHKAEVAHGLLLGLTKKDDET